MSRGRIFSKRMDRAFDDMSKRISRKDMQRTFDIMGKEMDMSMEKIESQIPPIPKSMIRKGLKDLERMRRR